MKATPTVVNRLSYGKNGKWIFIMIVFILVKKLNRKEQYTREEEKIILLPK